MRIISGILGGQVIENPKSSSTAIHPMSQKMRGALFSALGDITKLSILDAYSGSGAIALEAYSRNAGRIIAVDKNSQAAKTIQANIRKLHINNNILSFINVSIESWLKYNNNKDKFDIIIADPPYDNINKNIATIELLMTYLTTSGVFVLSWPTAKSLPVIKKLNIIKQKSYGDSQLIYYSNSTSSSTTIII